jgi:hypothetical protein
MKNRTLLAILLLAAAPLPLRGQQHFDKTIPFPRRGVARLNWSADRCSVLSLEVRNYPDEEDIEKARRSDPNDHSWLWWQFNVENRSDRKCRIKLWVDVLDKSGNVVKSGDRTDTVDADKLDDDIRVSTRMRTLDAADSPKVRVRAEIGSK